LGTFVTTTQVSKRGSSSPTSSAWGGGGVRAARLPRIKCNVAQVHGQRIYRLTFDQQYDTALIDSSRCERWAATVAEAEAAGFRRAWRSEGQPVSPRPETDPVAAFGVDACDCSSWLSSRFAVLCSAGA
jgi:hypothetical protein